MEVEVALLSLTEPDFHPSITSFEELLGGGMCLVVLGAIGDEVRGFQSMGTKTCLWCGRLLT